MDGNVLKLGRRNERKNTSNFGTLIKVICDGIFGRALLRLHALNSEEEACREAFA